MIGPARPVVLALLAGLLAWLAVAAMLAWAHRVGMIDQPGFRRSHQRPTPRGGGIGMMLVMLLLLPCCGWSFSSGAALELALLAVALIGAWDDVRSLGAGRRFGVQVLAVLGLAVVVLLEQHRSLLWLLVLLPFGVWSINLHNFMDGIDGLLAGHTVVVAMALAALAVHSGQSDVRNTALVLAAASVAFVSFNWAPARLFMGDAGSGGIGLLLFGLSAVLVMRQACLVWPVLAISSSFVVDASFTLLSRIYRRRRWTQPHREHAYQWLVRRGRSHAQVSGYFLGWDLLVALLALSLVFARAAVAPFCVAAYLIASVAWLRYKSRCLLQRRQKGATDEVAK